MEVQCYQRVQEVGDIWKLDSAGPENNGPHLRLIYLIVRDDLTGSRRNDWGFDGNARHRGGRWSCVRTEVDAQPTTHQLAQCREKGSARRLVLSILMILAHPEAGMAPEGPLQRALHDD